ncbi:MAG: type II toxin-antitoxin system RelE/ParE family toxin [Gemmataceae bacterium]
MAFSVVFRRRAESDLATHIERLVANRRHSAARLRAAVVTTVIPALEHDPHRYAEADEAADLGINLRELDYGRRRLVYRFLFTIDGETVNVHRVRYAAQDRLTEGDL